MPLLLYAGLRGWHRNMSLGRHTVTSAWSTGVAEKTKMKKGVDRPQPANKTDHLESHVSSPAIPLS